MTELDRTLSALADPTRRRVVDLLRTRPHRAGELSTLLGMTPPAMSRHLRLLRAEGLVEEEHQGQDARVRTYRLKQAPFSRLRRWAEDVEQFWAVQLTAFKEHAERTRGKAQSAPQRRSPTRPSASKRRT
jgi:DNA-binding transcriptional ArsR family regulator